MTGQPGTRTSLTPHGEIRVTPSRNGYWLVEIGRAKYVKRLNVSRTEAAELVRVLTTEVLTTEVLTADALTPEPTR
jgi:hypothetical protein